MSLEEPVLVQYEPLHHVIFENAELRVIEAILASGETTLLHTHELENVAITIEASRLWSRDVGGERVEYDAFLGRAVFKRAPYTHWVGNVGEHRVRIVHVESLASPVHARHPVPAEPPAPGHRLELENDSARILRVVLAPGGRCEAHRHAFPTVLVAIGGGVRNGGRMLSAGDFAWFPDGDVPESENVSAVEAELVEIEWRRS